MRTVAIIQARLASTRLPGKVLMDVAGKPMLQHVIERVKRAKLVDEVALAIPWGIENYHAIFERFNDLCHIFAFNVPENDLIARYYEAAKITDADLIVRICGDNPCIEPTEIDFLLGPNVWEELKGPARFSLQINSESMERDHDGFGGELYSTEILKWMDETINNSFYREHPHRFWAHLNLTVYVGKSYPSGFRLDVNTMEDYLKLKAIFEQFAPRNDFTVAEVIEYLEKGNALA